MACKDARRAWGLVLAGGLLLLGGARASAGSLPWEPHDCPKRAYSPLHIATPEIYRLKAWCQGPKNYIYPKDLHPDIPLEFHPIPYRCYAVDPRTFSLDHYYPGLRLPAAPPPPASPPEEDRADKAER